MKSLKKIQLKIFVAFTTLFLVAVSVFGINVKGISAKAADIPDNTTYISTEVERIVYAQHPNQVYFGFALTQSDYDDHGKFETDWKEKPEYQTTYNDYINNWLTYYKNFADMNSEGVRFTINYTYWNGAAFGSGFTNTVAHRSSLKLLEYGFAIYIPAGTTFPSFTYVVNGCTGNPVMYKTTTDKAFFFDGDEFVSMPYSAAVERRAAYEELKAFDYSNYYEAEVAKAETIVDTYMKKINVCNSGYQVQDALQEFYATIAKVMTKTDYATLATQKVEAKAELAAYIAGFSQADYENMDWMRMLDIQIQGEILIDSVNAMGEVEVVLEVLKLAADNVLTKTEKPVFEEYVAEKIQQLTAAFNADLYYEAERAEGAALISQGTNAIASANTYNEVDGLYANYLVKINSIKTAVQIDAETEVEIPQPDSSNSGNQNASKDEGCGSVASATGIIFGVAVMAVSMVIKKKADNKDEN